MKYTKTIHNYMIINTSINYKAIMNYKKCRIRKNHKTFLLAQIKKHYILKIPN